MVNEVGKSKGKRTRLADGGINQTDTGMKLPKSLEYMAFVGGLSPSSGTHFLENRDEIHLETTTWFDRMPLHGALGS